MATLVTIGEYANTSEKWAAEFLAERLPEEWMIYTNLTLPFAGQQPEIDLLIVGSCEVLLVEVKGYGGKVKFTQTGVTGTDKTPPHVFLNYNPAARIDLHAKKLAGLWEDTLGTKIMPPWCRGLVFVTGKPCGENLTLDTGGVHAYGPAEIVARLTTPVKHYYAITDAQRQLLDELLRLDMVAAPAELVIRDFEILKKTPWDGGFGRWEAKASEVPNAIFDLRVADFTNGKGLELSAKKNLEREATLLTCLSHISGIQRAWKLFEEKGPVVVLPLIRPKGKPVAEHTDLAPEEQVKIAEQLVEVLAAAHEQQFVHGALSRELLWWDRPLSLLTVCGWGRQATPDPLADAAFLLQWVRGIGKEATSPASVAMRKWVEEEAKVKSEQDPILDLRDRLLAATVAVEPAGQGKPNPDEIIFEFKPGQKVGTELELVQFLGTGATGSVWRARHNVGQFDCALKFMEIDEENEQRTSQVFAAEFDNLRALYHPNLVRVYDAKEIQGQHYLMLEFCEETLRDWIDGEESLKSEQITPRMRDGLAALEYLHVRDCQHGDLCPESIGLTAERAYLLDLGFIPRSGPKNPRYLSPYLGCSAAFNDLYALVLCMWEALVGYPFPGQIPDVLSAEWKPCKRPNNLNKTTWQKMVAILRGELPVTAGGQRVPYLEWFGFQNPRLRGDNPIPEKLRKKYDINDKYEQYLVAALLENDGKLSKRNLLIQAVRRRNLPASQKNLALHANYLPGLRNKKIVDYPVRQRRYVRVSLCPEFHKELLKELGE